MVSMIDKDLDGEMSWGEMRTVVVESSKEHCREEHPGKENKAERKACKKRMREEGKMMFDMCDSDMSGKVNAQEFMDC